MIWLYAASTFLLFPQSLTLKNTDYVLRLLFLPHTTHRGCVGLCFPSGRTARLCAWSPPAH